MRKSLKSNANHSSHKRNANIPAYVSLYRACSHGPRDNRATPPSNYSSIKDLI